MIDSLREGPKAAASLAIEEHDKIRLAIAKLYLKGMTRNQIAHKACRWLVNERMRERPIDQQVKRARQKLARWEQSEEFRNLIYGLAITGLDLRTPAIINGIASKAEAGRVDAARLALELTGRHNPKGDNQPTAVVIQVNGVPRPSRGEVTDDEILGELTAEEG